MAVQTQIQARRGTAATWTSTNPTLAAGETGYETDTGKFKIGTGSTAWASLGYFNQDPVTTKGDLFTFSTTDARLAVGNDGESLLADSAAATGLRWQKNYAAGKNLVINGGFDIWQRSTSSSTVSTYSTADRWYNGGSGTVTFSQDTDIPSGVTVQYSSKWLTSASSSYGQYYYAFEQAIVKPLRNQQMTLSYYIKSAGSQAGSIATLATYSNSTDALTSQTTAITSTGDTSYAASTVTSFTKKSITFTVPADAVGLRFSIVPGSVQASGVSNFLTGVQLEIGATATPFSRNSSTIQSELAACQRYYQILGNCFGYAYSTTEIQGMVSANPMRTTPSASLTTSSVTAECPISVTARTGSGSSTINSPNLNAFGSQFMRISGFTGLTVATTAFVGSGQIILSAEL